MRIFQLLFAFVYLFSNVAVAAGELEPNNSISQTNLLAPNIIITGQLSSSNDQDWYKISTSGAGDLTVSFTSIYCQQNTICGSPKLWNIDVLDSSGNLLSSKTRYTNSNSATQQYAFSVGGAGQYFIKIYWEDNCCNYSSDSDYRISVSGGVLTTPSSNSTAMTLQDALYLYDQNINSYNWTDLVGRNCEIFELVLDVDSGYTDVYTDEGSGSMQYPDRIRDYHKMFAYTLYKNSEWKTFSLSDKDGVLPDKNIASATIFGYCFSTNPDAYVYVLDQKSNTCKFSNGNVITNCIK